jgi:hypothetical protein
MLWVPGVLRAKLGRPLLSSMKDPEHAYDIGLDYICGDIGRSLKNEFTRARDAPGSTYLRHALQRGYLISNEYVDARCRAWAISFDRPESIRV